MTAFCVTFSYRNTIKEMNRTNHPGEGTEYEVFLPALLGLRLCFNSKVENFEMRSNVQDFANLDDLLLTIKMKDGVETKFAVQLKHKEQECQRLTNLQFENDKGDFSIAKYCEGYSKIEKEDKSEYRFIIYTNKNCDPRKVSEMTYFKMSQHDKCPGRDYFYLNKSNYQYDNKAIYKFEVNEKTKEKCRGVLTQEIFENFLSKLSLYTNQLNASEMEKEIGRIFQEKFSLEEKVDGYLRFFRDWHKKKFADGLLNMDMVKYKLFDLFLMPHIFKICSVEEQDIKLDLIQKTVDLFDVTICGHIAANLTFKSQKIDENVLSRKVKYYKFVTKDINVVKMSDDDKTLLENKIQWCFYQKPVIVKFDLKSRKSIYEMIRLLSGKLKVFLVGEEIDKEEFSELAVFQNLSDLKRRNSSLFEEVIQSLKISLQGRSPGSFQNLIDDVVGDVSQFLTLNEILKFDVLNVGEQKEALPDYVSRKVETVIITVESLKKNVKDSFIIDCGDNGDLMKSIKDVISARIPNKNLDSEQISENTLLVLRNCDMEKFNSIVANVKKGNIHYLRALDSTLLEWVSTKDSIENIRRLDSSKRTIDESEIHKRFTNTVNVICARPGMGKSTILKSIKNQTPSDFWTVKINLIEHNDFFQIAPDLDQLVDKFFNTSDDILETILLQNFLKKKRILWFFDGVDEMQTECVKNAIKCVQLLASEGHRIWVSSRYNFQKLLETSFSVLAIDIEELAEDSQKEYIEKRLRNNYTPEQIVKIIDKLYQNARIKENSNILGIPLQLYMLTEILLTSQKNLDEDIFVLTRMYHNFFRAKLRHYYKKSGCLHLHYVEKELEGKLQLYQLCALRHYLDSEFYKSLNLFCPEYIDEQGIFIKMSEDGTISFDHNTHAEYLAACWLSKNFKMIPEEKRYFIFEDKFDNLRFLFDMVLAENHPVILATLTKDVGTLSSLPKDDFNTKDAFGRNALHICCSYGTKYPRVELERHFQVHCIKRVEELNALLPDPLHEQVLEYLLGTDKFDPLDVDDLFQINCFHYADLGKSLISLMKISEIQKYDLDNLRFYNDILTVICYSVLHRYPSLLKLTVNKRTFGKIANMKIKTVTEEGTFLHIATKKGFQDIVELLLNNGADFNITDSELRKPIVIAAGENHVGISKLFEERNAISLPVATFLGRIDIIQKFLERGGNIDEVDPCYGGTTALFAAAFAGHLQLLQHLVRANANFKWRNQHGYNAVHVASEKGFVEMVKYLIGLGMDIDVATDFGSTALLLAVKHNHVEVVKHLPSVKADIRAIDIMGRSTIELSTTAEMVELLRIEIDKLPDVSLHWSAHHGDVDAIRNHLITTTEDLDNCDRLGRTSLFLGARKGHEDVVKMLIEVGACVNIADEMGDAPLHVAVEKGHAEVVRILLEAASDVKQINRCGRTPLQMTYKAEILKVFKTSSKHDKAFVTLNDFHRAAAVGNVEKLKSLLEVNKQWLDEVDPTDGQTALHWAAREGHPKIVLFLIKSGIDANRRNKTGHTALYLAIRYRHSTCVKHLIDATEDIEASYEKDNRALHVAALSNSCDAVQELLKIGANVNSRNVNARTPLHLAVEFRHQVIVKLLMEGGANPEATDADGLTPFHCAYGNKEIVTLLKISDN